MWLIFTTNSRFFKGGVAFDCIVCSLLTKRYWNFDFFLFCLDNVVGIWGLNFGIYLMFIGIWDLNFGIYPVIIGIWNL